MLPIQDEKNPNGDIAELTDTTPVEYFCYLSNIAHNSAQGTSSFRRLYHTTFRYFQLHERLNMEGQCGRGNILAANKVLTTVIHRWPEHDKKKRTCQWGRGCLLFMKMWSHGAPD